MQKLYSRLISMLNAFKETRPRVKNSFKSEKIHPLSIMNFCSKASFRSSNSFFIERIMLIRCTSVANGRNTASFNLGVLANVKTKM